MNVSVVIPVRNDAPMLRRALRALAAQTRPADEIVIVDNGSTDDSAGIAAAAGAVVVSEPITGIPRASAAGYDAATGDIIMRIDADTVVPVDWIARALADFADPALDLLTGHATFYGAGRLTRRLGKAWWVGGMYWSMGVYLGASTKIVDRATGEVHRGEVPPYAVVVPGAMPGKPLPDGSPGPSLYCAVIVKTVDAQTRAKTGINDLLRD